MSEITSAYLSTTWGETIFNSRNTNQTCYHDTTSRVPVVDKRSKSSNNLLHINETLIFVS